jgi:hypothetical protein
MKKELLEYINGKRNAVKDEFIISREMTERSELVYINHPEVKRPIYKFWQGTRKEELRKEKITGNGKGDSGTGGKPVYVKLMIERFHEEIENGLSVEAVGFFMVLCNRGLTWSTNKVCRPSKERRNRKSLSVKGIAEVVGVSVKKTKRLICELKAHGMIFYDRNERAYFLSRDFVIKGR